MQIGDLVKFKRVAAGLDRMIGIVIGFNGDCPIIHWTNDFEPTCEDPVFIEVINDSR